MPPTSQAPLQGTTEYLALRVNDESAAPLFHRGDLVLARVTGVFNETIKAGDVVVLDRRRWTFGEGEFRQVTRVTKRSITVKPLRGGRARVIRDDEGRVLGPVVLRWCSHVPRRMEVRHAS